MCCCNGNIFPLCQLVFYQNPPISILWLEDFFVYYEMATTIVYSKKLFKVSLFLSVLLFYFTLSPFSLL